MTNSAWVARVFNVGFGLAAAGFAVRCAYLCFSLRNILVFDRKRNAVRRGKRLVGNLDQIAAIQVCPSSATSNLKVLFGNDTSIPVGGVRVVGADEANRLADEIARFLGIRKDNLELSPEYLEARCQDDRMTILNATPVWKLAIRTLAKFPATAPGVVLLFMGIRYLLSSTDPLAWWIVWAGAFITVVTLFVIGFDFVL